MRQFVQISNLSPEANSRQVSILVPATGNGTFPIILKSGLRHRVVGASYQTNSGTATLAFKVGSTNIPNMTGLNASSTPQTQLSTADEDNINILDNNETLNMEVASASSLQWVYVTVYLRQIAAIGGFNGSNYDNPQTCEYVYNNVAGTGNPPTPGSGGGGTPGLNTTVIDWAEF